MMWAGIAKSYSLFIKEYLLFNIPGMVRMTYNKRKRM
jgi:hypothetical protein